MKKEGRKRKWEERNKNGTRTKNHSLSIFL